MSELRHFRCYPVELLGAARGLCPVGQSIYLQAVLYHFAPDPIYSNGPNRLPADPNVLRRFLGQVRLSAVKRALRDLVDLGNVTIEDGYLVPRVPWDDRPSRPNVSPSLREQVLGRDGERCRYCGTDGGPFDIDHIVPLARGGLHAMENLGVACATCNRSKGAKLLAEWLPDGAAQ
jgi:5-methylcytosine-specific restriction endonuclease McrA